MYDFEIRRTLKSYIKTQNYKEPDTLIIDEFDICSGLARVDLAVINGVIHGYEIKGEFDTLTRLPSQISYYNKSLEKISISISSNHLEKTSRMIPEWWGLLVVEKAENEVIMTQIRKAEYNPEIDIDSMLQILWKGELLALLSKYNIQIKTNQNKKYIRRIIADNVEKDKLTIELRQCLKSRKNWRS